MFSLANGEYSIVILACSAESRVYQNSGEYGGYIEKCGLLKICVDKFKKNEGNVALYYHY